MKTKELRLVITFPTTTSALAMEKTCKEKGGNGRLIPVPQQITAGCGLAWSAEPEAQDALLVLMAENNLKYEQAYKLEI